MKYRTTWDLTTVPEAPFNAEHARRQGLKGGRPIVWKPCPFCGVEFGAAALRKHQPSCSANPRNKKED